VGIAEFDRCTFENNKASYGAGIYAERGSIVCRECEFTRNRGGQGVSVYALEAASVTLINCRLTDNEVSLPNTVNSWDLYVKGPFTMINCTLSEPDWRGNTTWLEQAHIVNSILRGPDVLISGTVSYSNVEAYKWGGVGNIDADPAFVNSASGDYRLLWYSPCIDRATSGEAPDRDLEGNPRPVDIRGKGFDGPGQGFDMGCFEFYVPASPTPTVAPTPSPSATPGGSPTAVPTPTPVVGDLNGDGRVDALDLYIFTREWQRRGG